MEKKDEAGKETPAEKKLVGYQYTYIADIGAGQQIQVTGNLPVGVSQGQVETEFKLFRNVFEKHRVLSAIPGLKKEITDFENRVKQTKDSLDELDGKNKGKQLKTVDAAARETALQNIRHGEEEIRVRKVLLAEWEKQVA